MAEAVPRLQAGNVVVTAVSGGDTAATTEAGPRLLTDAELEVLDAVTRQRAQWSWRSLPEPEFAWAATLRICQPDGPWENRAELGVSLVRDGWLQAPYAGRTFAGLADDYTKADPRLIPDLSAGNIAYGRRALWECHNGSHAACGSWEVTTAFPIPGRPETRKPPRRLFCPCDCGHIDAARRIERDGRGIAPGLTAEQTIAAFPAKTVAS